MTESQIISWIFCSIAMASEKEPSKIQDISMIADGINHAVPTQSELKLSLKWLIQNDLIKKESNKYTLTNKGQLQYNFAQQDSKTVLNIWKKAERQLNISKA